MKNTRKRFFQGLGLSLVVGGVFLSGFLGIAQAVEVNNFGENLGFSTSPLENQIIAILTWILGFLALIAVIFIIYGGFIWMTAAGNADRIDRAKKIILGALIGLVIILLSWAIVWFVISGILESGEGGPFPPDDDPPPGDGPGGATEFFVQWHTPASAETNVSLCRGMQAKFNKAVNEGTATANITMTNVADGTSVSGSFDYSSDSRIVSFDPDGLLNSTTWYLVDMPEAVESADGDSLTPEIWQFQTGLEEDPDPPVVSNTWPNNGDSDICLTTPIVVEFNEPMDALTLKAENVEISPVEPSGLSIIDFDVVNDRTISFRTNLPLNPDTNYFVTLKSSDLNPVDPIADACGNPLDGDANGTPEPSYVWSFTTGTDAGCPPTITSMASSGYYESILTIEGFNFTDIAQEVVFFDQANADSNCFDGNFWPGVGCVSSWSNTQIQVQVPADGGVTTNGTNDGPVHVLVGGVESNSENFDLRSPYINNVLPDSGGPGKAITISGENFGGSEGTVWFRKLGGPDIPGETVICEDAWQNEQIIVAVPDGFVEGDTVWIQIEKEERRSNLYRPFTISNEGGPVLCDIEPSCGVEGDPVIFSGDGFADSPGAVNFGGANAGIDAWAPTEITAFVPAVADGEDIDAAVWQNGWSNPLPFNKPCGPGDDDDDGVHAECAGLVCIEAAGGGPDLCSDDADCTESGDTHSECNALEQCTVVPGAGSNECLDSTDCETSGSGAACSSDLDACVPDDSLCAIVGEECRPSDCSCRVPAAYACSSDTWSCVADPVACGADAVCNTSCQCDPRPQVVTWVPQGSDICRNSMIEVGFDQAMTRGTINNTTVTVTAGGAPVTGSFSYPNASRFRLNLGLLEPNTEYAVLITGGDAGVLNTDDVGMNGDFSWSFTTSDTVCEVTKVVVDPSWKLFTQNLETQSYMAQPYHNDIPLAEAPGVYEWDWSWESLNTGIITVTDSDDPEQTGTADNTNGETEIHAELDVTTPGLEKTVIGSSTAVVSLCENPWPRDVWGDWPYVEANTGFSIWYCLDEGLPGFTQIVETNGPPEVVREVFFTGLQVCQDSSIDCSPAAGGAGVCDPSQPCTTLEDVVGIRVMPNTDTKYSPELWFEKNLPEENIGNPNVRLTDGYESISVGRTRYVAATHLAGSLYANMYLLSRDEDASEVTKTILSEMANRWRFNVNVGDETVKQQLRNDMARMSALHDVRDVVEDYYALHLEYPTLDVGSYLPNRSTSAWPSWQATLGNALGKRLAVDPLNVFQVGASCVDPPFESTTCWHEEEFDGQFGEEGGEFQCDPDSRVAMYKYIPGADELDPGSVELYTNLEYPSSWVTGAGNPCADTVNSSCGCFNYLETVSPSS
ncbi:MAG: Ig-like domain-containing protein [bacterium]|nr:Ig-like domain-containing protein [bacterium]